MEPPAFRLKQQQQQQRYKSETTQLRARNIFQVTQSVDRWTGLREVVDSHLSWTNIPPIHFCMFCTDGRSFYIVDIIQKKYIYVACVLRSR